MWKVFCSFLHKEVLHILRDPRTLGLLLGLPVVLVTIFGFAITTEVNNIRIGVVYPCSNEEAQQLVHKLAGNPSIHLIAEAGSLHELSSLLQRGAIDAVLSFDYRFDRALSEARAPEVAIFADGTDPNTSAMAVSVIEQTILQYAREKGIRQIPPYTILPTVQLLFNPSMHAAYYFVPGVMGLILMLVCATMTSVSIVREKEQGSMETLLVSPVPPPVVVISKILPYFVISLINFACILLLACLVLNVPFRGPVWPVLLLALLFSLVSLLLGLLISSYTNKQSAATILSSVGLLLPVAILSGMLFPIESMPTLLRYLANIVPAKWFVEGLKKVMIQGLDASSVIRELSVLTGMIGILLLINIKAYKVRLD